MNNLDFLNANTLRNYPIKDVLSRVSIDTNFVIPNDFIADLAVAAPANNLELYISKVTNTSAYITVEISVITGAPVGSFYVPTDTGEYVNLTMTASTNYPSACGVLTVGSLASMLTSPSGDFVFASDGSTTALLMRVFSPATSGVNYITFKDASGTSTTLTGDVVIQGESNLQFRADGNTIYIDAGEGLGLNKNCGASPVPIQTINGIPPDVTGNFTLIPSDCISITTAEAGLVLENTCGKPCLGCSDISTLTDRLVTLESDLLHIRDYVNNLQGLIGQLTTMVNYQCQC